MKILISLLLTTGLVSASFITLARDFYIALSPHQSSTQAKAQVTHLLQFAVALDGGDRVMVLDGFHIRTIATFAVPENARYNSPKARLVANRNAVAALMAFANNASGKGHFIFLPKLLRHIAQSQNGDTPLEVIVRGSPFYADPADPAFSMLDAVIPSDGHITASRAETPFGTKEYQNALKNLRIHWLVMNDNAFQSDRHRFYVERFWTLFIEAQGGVLSTYSADQATVFNRAKSGAPAMPHALKIEPSAKREMIHLAPTTLEVGLFERDISDTPLPSSILRRAENVLIGITWDCQSCDLDLFVQLPGQGEPVYFLNTEVHGARHFKDFTDSPSLENAFETVELTIPFDLHNVRIAVNLFEGDLRAPVTGELRLSAEGHTYAQAFSFPPGAGRLNSQSVIEALNSGQADSHHTLLIDPVALTQIPRGR